MAKPCQKWGELGVVADVAWTDGRPGRTRLRRKFERLPFYLFPPPLVALFLALLWYDNEAPLCNFVRPPHVIISQFIRPKIASRKSRQNVYLKFSTGRMRGIMTSPNKICGKLTHPPAPHSVIKISQSKVCIGTAHKCDEQYTNSSVPTFYTNKIEHIICVE